MFDMVNVLVAIIGAAALALSSSFPTRWLRRLTRRALADLPQMSCRELGEARRRRRMAVRGVTAPGSNGPLTAPVSGASCVWFRVRLRTWANTREGVQAADMWTHEAGDDLGLDDGTGRALVSASLLDAPALGRPAELIERPPLGNNPDLHPRTALLRLSALGILTERRIDRLLRPRRTMWIEEEVVRPGRPVLVVGSARRRRGLMVVRERAIGWSGVTQGSLQSLRRRLVRQAEEYLWWVPAVVGVAGAFLLGGAIITMVPFEE